MTWSLSNEWQNTSLPAAKWNDLGCAISGCTGYTNTSCTGADFTAPVDPWFKNGNKTRPLTIHSTQDQLCFSFFASPLWASCVSIQRHKNNMDAMDPNFAADKKGYDSVACNRIAGSTCAPPTPALPVVNDEYGYLGVAGITQTEHRNAIWGIATGGGYGTAGDAKGATPPIQYSNWIDRPEYGDIKRLVSFFTSSAKAIQWWKMVPQNTCQQNTRVHTLAEVGKQYVVYTADGLSFPVSNLTLGNYRVIWYDPRNANANDPNAGTNLGCVNVTSNVFTPPGGSPGDWVLLLQKTATCL